MEVKALERTSKTKNIRTNAGAGWSTLSIRHSAQKSVVECHSFIVNLYKIIIMIHDDLLVMFFPFPHLFSCLCADLSVVFLSDVMSGESSNMLFFLLFLSLLIARR